MVPAVQAIVATCVVVMNFLLIPRFGIEGSALSLAAGGFLLVIVQDGLNRMRNYSYSTWRDQLPLLSTFMALIAVQIIVSKILSVSQGLLAGAVLFGIYIFAAWLFFPAGEKVQVRHWMSQRMSALQ